METQAQKNIINVLYLFLIVSTITGFMPSTWAQEVSLVLVIISLIAAYWYRSRDEEDGLVYNHMTYLIGTIWNGTTFMILGMLAAGAWVYLQGDNSVLDHSVQQATDQILSGGMPTDAQMSGWMDEYLIANKSLTIMAGIICVGPGVLYFIYRVANGYARAMKGYRIAKPRSWL